ncbi:MAG: hypothetical protein V1734_01370 [Nanoarchaeota archaeon]
MGTRLFPERKVKLFLDALIKREHIPVSTIERTEKNERMILIAGKTVFFSERHGKGFESGIKEPYLKNIINAAAEAKYGLPGTPQYDAGRKAIKKLARETVGY